MKKEQTEESLFGSPMNSMRSAELPANPILPGDAVRPGMRLTERPEVTLLHLSQGMETGLQGRLMKPRGTFGRVRRNQLLAMVIHQTQMTQVMMVTMGTTTTKRMMFQVVTC